MQIDRWMTLAAALLLSAGAQAQEGAALFGQRCAVCHGERGEGGLGPALAGVWQRQAGTARFGYSQALREAGFTWDAAHLDRYLADPAAAVPGTSMVLQTRAPAERQALIAYMQTLHPKTAGAGPPAQSVASSPTVGPLLTGAAAFGDWRNDAPGVRRLIRPSDEPPPYATRSAGNAPDVVPRPSAAMPKAPPGFRVTLFAQGLRGPRLLRTAPNGDVFVAETGSGRIRVLRAHDGAPHVEGDTVFASGLRGPFGLAFYPPGANPRYLYVGLNNQVVRFPYQSGGHGGARREGGCRIRTLAHLGRPFDARRRLRPGRQPDVRLGRLGVERGGGDRPRPARRAAGVGGAGPRSAPPGAARRRGPTC